MIKAGATPEVKFPGTNRPWKCKCIRCGNDVFPTLGNVYRLGTNPCRFCASKVRGRNRRDIIAVTAYAFMVEVGLVPLKEFPGVAKPWKCKCRDCGKSTTPQFRHVRNGHRCRYCTNTLRGDRRTAVGADDARRRMLKAGLTPLERYPGSLRKWKCECRICKEIVRVPHSQIQQGGGGCKVCASRKAGMKRKSANSKRAEEVMLRAGLIPLEGYPGALTNWRCRCSRCGRIVAPRYTAVDQGSGGCRFCAASGFHRDRPGILYLMKSTEFFALKIGITGDDGTLLRKNRVKQHGDAGWELVAKWHVKQGSDAEDIESIVLAWWRVELAAPAAVSKSDMPQGGWTETASLLFVTVDDTINYVKSRIHD